MSELAVPFLRPRGADRRAHRAGEDDAPVGFVRTRLFNSPINIVLTILGALLIWFTVVPR